MWFPFVSLPFNFNSIFCTPANNANSTPCHLRTHFSSLLCWVHRETAGRPARRAAHLHVAHTKLSSLALQQPRRLGFSLWKALIWRRRRTFPLEHPLRIVAADFWRACETACVPRRRSPIQGKTCARGAALIIFEQVEECEWEKSCLFIKISPFRFRCWKNFIFFKAWNFITIKLGV